jgi:hypothetical protein
MLTLSPDELRELTGYARRGAQSEWLTVNGIPFRLDGARLLVARVHAEAWLGGKEVMQPKGFDLSAVK